MVYIIIYGIASVILVAILLGILWLANICCRNTRFRISSIWLRRLKVLIILLPFLPYLVIECQTLLFGHGLIEPARQALKVVGESTNIRTFKVMRVTPAMAKVYAVDVWTCSLKNGTIDRKYVGVTLVFYRQGGRWVFDERSCDAVWSERGNADGDIFPPYLALGDYK